MTHSLPRWSAALAAAATLYASAAHAALEVDVDGPRFSVRASDAPVTEILGALRDGAGFRLAITGNPPPVTTSVEIDAATWHDGLKVLLEDWRYALSLDPETREPVALVVMTYTGPLPAADAPAALEGEEAVAAEGTLEGASDAGQGLEAGEDLDEGSTLAPPPTVRVDLENGTFEVVSEGAPLGEILDELSILGEFELVENVDTGDDPVTVTLPPIAWDEGLEQLLADWRYALQMDASGQRPEKLVIMSVHEQAVAAAPEPSDIEESVEDRIRRELEPASPSASLDEAMRIAEELAREQEDPVAYRKRMAEEAATRLGMARAMRQDPEANDEQRLAAARAESVASREYVEALHSLGQFTDPKAITDPAITYELVAPAVRDPSSDVRATALATLRHRGLDDKETLDGIRDLIGTDPDPAVRREALEVYSRYGDQREVLTLMQELGREPSPVRDLALREWIRIERENEQVRSGADDRQLIEAQAD